MHKGFIGIATIVLCSLGSAALAQDNQPTTHAIHAENAKHPAHAKKTAKAPDGFQDWVIANPGSAAKPADLNGDPSLEERRKHFFDQSTTMENGGPANSGGSGTGFRPSAGFNF